MSIKIRIVTSFLLFLLAVPGFAESDLEKATAVAQKGYSKFVTSCIDNPQTRSRYAIGEASIQSILQIGEGIKQFLIEPDVIKNFRKDGKTSECLTPIDAYYFPISLNGKQTFLLNVVKYKGSDTYEIASLGRNWLATELTSIETQYPRSSGYTLTLVESLQTGRFAFHIPQKGETNLTIIEPGSKRGYATLSSIEESMTTFKKLLNTSMSLGGK